jgi:hypothetical protein
MKDKIVICFFGVIARSLRYTHFNLKNNLIEICKRCYDVDIYIFNNKLLDANFIEEEKQVNIDLKIKKLVSEKNIICKMRRDYTPTWIINSIRQMYSEEKVGNFLKKNKHKYKCAIVCGPDYFLLNQIKIIDIQDSIKNKNCVYTTRVNDAQGYTNGFYIGAPEPIIKITKRFSILDKLLPTDKDYEYLLKKTFEMKNVERKITETLFFKIRSSKEVARQGIMQHPYFTNILALPISILSLHIFVIPSHSSPSPTGVYRGSPPILLILILLSQYNLFISP